MPVGEQLVQDVRHAVRTFRRGPGFAAAAVVTLGLGLAAVVTVVSFVDTVFLRPLPVATADRLVRVHFVHQRGAGEGVLGFAASRYLRAQARSFDLVAAHYSTAPLYVGIGGESREVQGAVVSAEYFPMLGLTPRLGRFFLAGEDSVPDRDAVAVISHAMWSARFGGDPRVLGRRITINQRAFEIIGVAPAGFDGVLPGAAANEIWIPTAMLRLGYRWCDALSSQPPCAVTEVLARLAPGATLARARAEVAGMTPRLIALSDPTDSLRTAVAAPATGVRPADRDAFRGVAQLLAAIAATLLAVACTNVSGLLLARGIARGREIALRSALGAGRGRLVRQLLAESAVLALAGGALGVGLSCLATPLLVRLFDAGGEGYAHFSDTGPGWRVLAAAAGVLGLTVLAFGLLPALYASRADGAELVRQGAGGGRGARSRLRGALVSTQVALSLALLVGAGLLLRSFSRATGWQQLDGRRVALLRLRPRLVGYEPARAQAFVRDAVARLREMPAVEAVAYARGVGLVWGSTGNRSVARPGDAPHAPGEAPRVEYHEISPGFFSALRVPLLAGREFTDRDSAGAPRVAVVNATLASRLWPEGPAVGRTIRLDSVTLQVVGVVRDYRLHTATEPAPTMAFVPFWQHSFEPQVDARLAVRVRGDPGAALPALRRAIADVDPAVPVTEAVPMVTQVGAAYASVRLGGAVLAAAATLALILSGIGLYGVVAFVVARQTREIGIRMAIGARPAQVARHFLREGLRAATIGGAAGLALALLAGRLLGTWLVGVSPADVAVLAAASGSVAAVALIASYIPSRRAARVDPVAALRSE
ncbi:MAG TPA: ADOP family duplicated permease [Gemmatimonadaceae bacterium]|nr:ADOP family duplicated permease [Gemmatimonadaceae bacterium]